MTGVPTRHFDFVGPLQSLLTVVVIAVFVITFVVQAFQIPSESMENTLLIGDYLLVNKLRYGGGGIWDSIMPYRPIHRGDIIVFHYPVDPRQHFVKRVVAIPGDRIKLIQGTVYINGTAVSEPYVRHSQKMREAYADDFPRFNVRVAEVTATWWLQMHKLVEDGQLIVPEDCYFALGDNREESLDSRYWGFVPRENIIGTPLLIYWSVRSTDDGMPVAPVSNDRIYHFAYAVTHLFQLTRWDRTFRLVR
jgi:signal peptidase I